MSYNKKLPKVEGQDPIRPQFGTKVKLTEQSQDKELRHTEKPVRFGPARPSAKDSASGR